MDVAITRMSSKGQVVIPAELREGISEGDKLLVIRREGQIILKHADALDNALEDDLQFAKKTDEAWNRLKQGKGTTMNFDDFIEEMKTW